MSDGTVALSVKEIGITKSENLIGASFTPIMGRNEEKIIGIVDADKEAFYYSKATLSRVASLRSNKHESDSSSTVGQFNNYGFVINKTLYETLTGVTLSSVKNGVFGLFNTPLNAANLADGVYTAENSVKIGETYKLSDGTPIDAVMSDYDLYKDLTPSWIMSENIKEVESYLDGADISCTNLYRELSKSASSTLINTFVAFLGVFVVFLALSIAFLVLDLSSYTKASLMEVAVLRSLGIGKWEVTFAYIRKTLTKLFPSFAIGYLFGIAMTIYIKTYDLYLYFIFLLNLWVALLALTLGALFIGFVVFLYYSSKFNKTATSLKISAKI